MRARLTAIAIIGVLAAVVLYLARGPQSQSAAPSPQVEVVARTLEIPWAVDFAPDGRMFVTERPGRIRVIRDGRLETQPWATLPVRHIGEGGLLGLAVAPDFQRTGFVYVYHTYADNGRLFNRVVRLVDRDGRGQMDRVILDRIPGSGNHNGGRIKFGPDGKLYVTTGDAGQPQLAQQRESLAGKVLRINADGSVPSDNPFPGSPVYTLGHRNPQGLAWHPETKVLYESEHGPSAHDEINILESGKNYGWPEVTGTGGGSRFVDPIAESGGSTTWAPSGIAIPSAGPWRNSLLAAALRGNQLRRFVLQAPEFRRVTEQEAFFQNLGRLRDVVQGPDGSLYMLTSNRDGRGRPGPDDDRLLRIVFR
jgi:glucose/arabinose dehydrogenase